MHIAHSDAWGFQVAMKLAPDRKKFMDIISGLGDINADIEKFCATFSPLLAENHKFLVSPSAQPRLLMLFVPHVFWRWQFTIKLSTQASVGMDDLKASWYNLAYSQTGDQDHF